MAKFRLTMKHIETNKCKSLIIYCLATEELSESVQGGAVTRDEDDNGKYNFNTDLKHQNHSLRAKGLFGLKSVKISAFAIQRFVMLYFLLSITASPVNTVRRIEQ